MKKTMKQTKAYQLLHERNSELLQQVNKCISFAEEMLPLIKKVFDTYTIHGITHAVNVVEYMYDLVTDANELDDLELVMMIYVALLHDTGMIASDDEINDIKSNKILLNNRKYSKVLEKFSNETVALQECIRLAHGERSKNFIKQNCDMNFFLFLILQQFHFMMN